MIALINANSIHIPLRDKSVQCVITSPPYFGLRDYGTAQWEGGEAGCDHVSGLSRQDGDRETPGGRGGSFSAPSEQYRNICAKCGARRIDQQIGLEPTPQEYIAQIVAVMRECWRVLRDDGVMFLNLGDSYFGDSPTRRSSSEAFSETWDKSQTRSRGGLRRSAARVDGLKPKDLMMIPARVAIALQDDGWYLRSEIVWSKPNPMPESVTDRPTKAHEMIYLLTKRARYFYDAEAIKEPSVTDPNTKSSMMFGSENGKNNTSVLAHAADLGHKWEYESTRNCRSVWTVATSPYSGAHYATFPPDLVRPMVLAGTSPRACETCGATWERVVDDDGLKNHHGINRIADVAQGKHGNNSVFNTGSSPIKKTTGWRPTCRHDNTGSARCIILDPFCGSGTVGQVCREAGRDFVGIDLSLKYLTDNAMPRALNTNTARSMETLPMFANNGETNQKPTRGNGKTTL